MEMKAGENATLQEKSCAREVARKETGGDGDGKQ
jgi:hypothetical protein